MSLLLSKNVRELLFQWDKTIAHVGLNNCNCRWCYSYLIHWTLRVSVVISFWENAWSCLYAVFLCCYHRFTFLKEMHSTCKGFYINEMLLKIYEVHNNSKKAKLVERNKDVYTSCLRNCIVLSTTLENLRENNEKQNKHTVRLRHCVRFACSNGFGIHNF